MDWEVEVKFRVPDLKDVRARIVALGGDFQVVEQTDRYFKHPSRDFAATDEALRLRQAGDSNFVTYKGPRTDATTKTRRELEILLAPGQQSLDGFMQLLAALGFIPLPPVHKRRQTASIPWQGLPIEVALDEVREVGTFVELETIAGEAEVLSAQLVLASLAAYLGLHVSERRSYLELLLDSA